MIKPEELRIGNKIQCGSQVVSVEEIYGDEIETTEEGIVSLSHPQVNGIPLTEEWLVKFGFTKDLGYNIHLRDNLYLRLELPIKGSSRQSVDAILAWDYVGRWFSGHIKYVHEVQNLYFALTGEELKLA